MLSDDWVPVEGFPGYSVNPLGQVKNDFTKRILHTRQNQYGVTYVGMMRDGKQRPRSLALLVARAFLPQTNPNWDTPINLNGDRFNCRVDNLAWRPRLYAEHYNNQFSKARYSHPIETPVREAETDEEFPNSLAAGCAYGVLEREIVLSILNNTLTWPTYQKFVVVE